MLIKNFDYLEEDYGDKLISKIFGQNHRKIKNFEDFKEAVKFGKTSLYFNYDIKLLRDFAGDQNFGFHNGIKNIKNFGALIYIVYSLIVNHDYNLIYVIPVLFLIRHIILFLWYKKLTTTILLLIITYFTCNYFNLNYKAFLFSFIILQAVTESTYLSFLEQYFSFDEIKFGYGIEMKIISKVYDSYNKKIIQL